MKTLIRVAIAAQALLMLLIGVGFLLQPVETAAKFFIAPTALVGQATLRADMFGFFVGGSLFALYAAWKGRKGLLIVPMTLLGCAITGRLVSLAADGIVPGALPPLLVEVVMVSVLAIGMQLLDPAARK